MSDAPESDRATVVRRLFEARGAGDVEAALECVTQDVLIDCSRRMLDPGIFRGHEGLRQLVSGLGSAWARQELEPLELIESGECIVAPVRITSTGRSSGITRSAQAAWAFHFAEGRIDRCAVFQTKDDALAEAASEAARG